MVALFGSQFAAAELFALLREELALFAASFFLLGALDEVAVDLTYIWLRLSGRARTSRIHEAALIAAPLKGRCAVFIPAWQESAVIGATIAHALSAWPQREMRLYVGCYRNDPPTIEVAAGAALNDPRVRVIIHDVEGPTSKPDCLNRLYRALCEEEARDGCMARMVVLHDAEDMVDPAALPLLDDAIGQIDFAQLPVMALPQRGCRWIAGHYTDEFSEAHARTMVVRSALGAGIPGAGVGCAIARDSLARLDRQREGAGPFAAGSLTEDYELGLELAAMGARTQFLRMRTLDGKLIATRAYFPCDLNAAIRQKARWIHGIAFQGWDRLGWQGTPAGLWMMLRDRRGPLAALLLALAYLLVAIALGELILSAAGLVAPPSISPVLSTLLWLNFAALLWRVAIRCLFTAREFGWVEGLFAIPRTVVSNAIAITAGRRALFAYARTLRGGRPIWEKTNHISHPALAINPAGVAAR